MLMFLSTICICKRTKGVFGYHLFYWNWKFITENTVNKGKS